MRAARAVLLASVGLLAACADAPDPSEPDLALRPQMSAVTAGINETVPLAFSGWVPCADGGAGEFLSGSGDLHVRTHLTADAHGGVHVVQHFNPQGVSAVGATSGAVYRAVGMTRDQFNTGFGQTTSYVNNFRLIGRGLASNYSVHQNVHVTINADGTVSTTVGHEAIRCD
jgi:hypothetical protein